MDARMIPISDGSDINEDSTDTDEYDTAEENPDCISNECYYSCEEILNSNEASVDEYPNIGFIDEDTQDSTHDTSINQSQSDEQVFVNLDLVVNDKREETSESVPKCTSNVDKPKSGSDKYRRESKELEVALLERNDENCIAECFLTEAVTDTNNGFSVTTQKHLKSGMINVATHRKYANIENNKETISKELFNAHGPVIPGLNKNDIENHANRFKENNDAVCEEKHSVEENTTIKDFSDFFEIEDSCFIESENDIKELSFKEKLAYFEKAGLSSSGSVSNHQSVYAEVSHKQKETDMSIKMGVSEEDSSDELGSSAADETSYEDLLESLLESDQNESDRRKHGSDSEEFENSDPELKEEHMNNKYAKESKEASMNESHETSVMISNLSFLHQNIVPVKSGSLQLDELEHELIGNENILIQGPGHDIQILAPSEKERNSSLNHRRSSLHLESDASQQSDNSPKNQLECDAADAKETGMIQQEYTVSDTELQFEKNKIESPENNKKNLLLPVKMRSPVSEAHVASDTMINRQSSVIKENRLTKMPFADCSDSEIINDTEDTQDNIKRNEKYCEPTDNVIVRIVELGSAVLLEGSHYKNLRHAKLVNPFISLRRTGLLEKMTGSDSIIPIARSESISNRNIRRSVEDIIGKAKRESQIVPEVLISVESCTLDASENQSDTEENIQSPDSEKEEKERKKATKYVRRRMGRHNAIVSKYVANIEKAEKIRNSVIEDTIDIEPGDQEVPDFENSEKVDSFRHRSRSFLKDNETSIIRTVEIGTACLNEIPHLKYLHCAKISSPLS